LEKLPKNPGRKIIAVTLSRKGLENLPARPIFVESIDFAYGSRLMATVSENFG